MYRVRNNYDINYTNSFSTVHQHCTNCGLIGHSCRSCVAPVLSYGLLIFRFTNPEWDIAKNLCSSMPTLNGTDMGGKLQVLMIKRKDSLRFVEFVRGKYNVKDMDYIKTIVHNITPAERELILTKTFPELWQHVWGTSNPRNYRNDFEQSQIKFNELRAIPGAEAGKTLLEDIVAAAPVLWTDPEWGFPKGRRNSNESDLDCAIRETEEETGLLRSQMGIFDVLDPLNETFYGDNKVYYSHKYYLALTKTHIELQVNKMNPHMSREIGDIRWVELDDAISLIRPENVEKREVLLRAITIFRNYCPFVRGRFFLSR
jgi:8-oxo-dGTP pyrophosphatase MutT (NUDIX family)